MFAESQSDLSQEKIKSIWTMLVKNMKLNAYQMRETLYSRRQEFRAQGLTDENIGTRLLFVHTCLMHASASDKSVPARRCVYV